MSLRAKCFKNAEFQIFRFCPNVHNPLSISNVVFARQNHLQSAYHPISPNVPAVKVPLEGEREPNLEGEREARAENGISLGLHLPLLCPTLPHNQLKFAPSEGDITIDTNGRTHLGQVDTSAGVEANLSWKQL